MSILGTLSLILYAAVHTGQSCEDVFIQTVQAERPSISDEEMVHLSSLSEAACQTSNPDVIWKIAYQESSFRFDIVRINTKGQEVVLTGSRARDYLRRLKKSQDLVNVDIGVMQINWRWHGENFKSDPLAMLDPKNQVNYIMEHLSTSMVQRCADRWVGCYHHPSNQDRAASYQKKVLDKSKILVRNVLHHMKTTLDNMNEEDASSLPRIQKKEFFQTLQRSLQLSPPEDLEGALVGQIAFEMDQDFNIIN